MGCKMCEQLYHIKCQNITKAEYNYIKWGSKKKSLSKIHWYCQTCGRMAVNLMRIMTNLHLKQEKIKERINKLEGKGQQKCGQRRD